MRRRYLVTWVVSIAAFVALAVGCSSSTAIGKSDVRGNYFQNSDRVWAAVNLTLIELDYEVEKSNRVDGVIRALGAENDAGVRVALDIDQIGRTQDQTNVYVKPRDGGGSAAASEADLSASAKQFLAALDEQLNE